MPPKPPPPPPRKSGQPTTNKTAKEFENAIRNKSVSKKKGDLLAPSETTTATLPNTQSTIPPSTTTYIDVDISESAFLAESDLFFDEEEDKDYIDEATKREKYDIGQNVYKSFRPILYLMKLLGRWPLSSREEVDGSRQFEWNGKKPASIYYIFVTLLITYTLIVGSWSMMGIVLNIRVGPTGENFEDRLNFEYEKLLLNRHVATFVMLWTFLIHCVISSLTLLSRRKFMAFYFTFWTKAMPTMHVDAAKGTSRFMLGMALSYAASVITLVILSISNVSPSVVSAPTLFGILMFREYLAPLYELKILRVILSTTSTTTTTPPPTTSLLWSSTSISNATNLSTTLPTTPGPVNTYQLIEPSSPMERKFINVMGGIFFLVVFSASKVYMFVFIYKCKLLKNAFSCWNSRVYASILKGAKKPQNHENRTTFTLLFRDHCLLLDLMDGTDQLFATILESYFALQVCSTCFEAYFFIRTARYGHGLKKSYDDEFFIRPYDWLPAVVVFIQSLALLLMVTHSAAEVGEEAMAGFEVLRRRSLIGRKTNEELYFMLTMFASYTAYKKIELSAGGYFYLNKEFLIGVISTILSYFIIIYQIQPVLDYSYEALLTNSTKFYKRKVLGQFLNRVEGGARQYHNTEAPKR